MRKLQSAALLWLCFTFALFGQEVQIAEFQATDIAFDAQETQTFRTIHAPGASFIKVHFDYFKLPAGVKLEVRNPQGTEVYVYGMTQRDDYTFDPALEEDGWERFAAMSISGDKAIISLISTNDVALGADHAVYISRYMEGYPNGIIENLTGEPLYEEKSTCGVNERKPVECYSSSYPTEYARGRSVARLVMGGGLCTAWRVSDDNRMFTNNHCMASNADVTGSESWFNYQYTSCTGTTLTTPVKVSGASMLATSANLDYTLYTVNSFSSISSYGNLGLDVRAPIQNEEIYIPQHGSGNPKELAITDDQNTTGICRVDSTTSNSNLDAGYYCDTIGGSSGSPVLARSSHKVIALHHYGGCLNSGVKINLIWPEVSSHFGGVVPNGSGGGGGGNQSPVASFTSTTSDLTATFTSTSSDPDGTIASYAWNFGDGGTSSAQNPSRTYASAGTYTVTLTVTDNNGATGTSSSSVTVGGGSTGALTDGVAVSGLSATTNNWLHYYIDVPSGASSLTLTTTGSDPDADLYVKFGAQPTTSVNDCRGTSSSSNETCTIANPQAGRWFVSVLAYSDFAGLSLLADYAVSTGCTPYNNTVSNISSTKNTWKYYAVTVPACATSLSYTMSGGTGDADLYVRQGANPTTTSYACRPYKSGNNETCTFSAPASGSWNAGIYAYSAFSGVSLQTKYN